MAGQPIPAGTAVATRPARGRLSRLAWLAALVAGAAVFLFPFYYMLIGSLQTEPDSGPEGAMPAPGNLTTFNYAQIDHSLSLGRALVNSGIFTGGVVLCTAVFGVLAGYAL